jgi:hypothetical protein
MEGAMTRSWKTLAVLVATITAVLVLATTALAAFTTQRLASPRWASTLGAPSGRLAPGTAQSLPFTVVNAGQSTARLTTVTVSLPAEPNGDAETAAGADIPGCRAAWFTASVDTGNLPRSLNEGASYRGQVELTMRDSDTNQDACRSTAPALTVSAS